MRIWSHKKGLTLSPVQISLMLVGVHLQITLGSHVLRGRKDTGMFRFMEAKGKACFRGREELSGASDRSSMMWAEIPVDFSNRSHW